MNLLSGFGIGSWTLTEGLGMRATKIDILGVHSKSLNRSTKTPSNLKFHDKGVYNLRFQQHSSAATLRENGNSSAKANAPANTTNLASTIPSPSDNILVVTAPRLPKIEIVIDERSSTENTKEFLIKERGKPLTDNSWISLQQAQRDDRWEELLRHFQALEPLDKPQLKESIANELTSLYGRPLRASQRFLETG
nr:hypothetical protein L203_01959 [Cryptococcus depauperatus CBS 7841]